MRLGRWRVEAEQIRTRPAKRVGLLAPYREKLASILDALPPALELDEGRGLEQENAEDLPVTGRLRQLDDLDLAGDAIRLDRDPPVGRGRFSRVRLR